MSIALPIITTVFLAVVAAIDVARTLRIRRRWHKARGVILRYELIKGDECSFWHPVYEFRTSKGKAFVATSSCGWGFDQPWQIGDTVWIRYCSDDPAQSEIQSFETQWAAPLTAIGLTIVVWVFYWLW